MYYKLVGGYDALWQAVNVVTSDYNEDLNIEIAGQVLELLNKDVSTSTN